MPHLCIFLNQTVRKPLSDQLYIPKHWQPCQFLTDSAAGHQYKTIHMVLLYPVPQTFQNQKHIRILGKRKFQNQFHTKRMYRPDQLLQLQIRIRRRCIGGLRCKIKTRAVAPVIHPPRLFFWKLLGRTHNSFLLCLWHTL